MGNNPVNLQQAGRQNGHHNGKHNQPVFFYVLNYGFCIADFPLLENLLEETPHFLP